MPLKNLNHSLHRVTQLDNSKKKTLLTIAILLLLSLIVYHPWLNFSLFVNGDHPFFFPETMKDWVSPSIWSGNYAFGSVDFLQWRVPYTFLNGIFGVLGLSSQVAEKFLIMWPWAVLPVLAGFLLVKEVTRSTLAGLIGSLVVSYNTYFLSINTQGHVLLSLAAIFSIFSIWLLVKSIAEDKIIFSLLASLLLFIASFYDFRFFYITTWVFLFYGLFTVVTNRDLDLKSIFRIGVLVLTPILIVALLNFYYLFSLLHLGLLIDNPLLRRGLFGGEFWSLTRAITLFYPFWNGAEPKWFTVQPTPLYFWLIPIAMFLSLLFSRKNQNVLFFGLLSLIGVLLAKQSGRPFPELYLWLTQTIPGFGAFREASKFYFLVVVGYAVLIGAFIDRVWNNGRKVKLRLAVKSLLTLIISGIFLWNIKPLITGEVESLFVPRRIPEDYLIVKDFLSRKPEYFRTLWIPGDSRWSFYDNLHPKVNAFELERLMGLDSQIETNLTGQEKIVRILKQPSSDSFLDVTSIKYVFIPLQDKENDDDFYHNNGYERQFFLNELDKIDYLARKRVGTQEVVVYENINYKPHVYLTSEPENLFKYVPFQTVDFKAKSPSEYRILIRNTAEPVYLNLSESFHPDWKIKVGGLKWWKVLTQRDYFLPDKNHFKNDANFNSFLIDPAEIKRSDPERFTYIENPDGSIDLDLTLYFKPQSYFYLGLVISLVTLISLLAVVSSNIIKKLYQSFLSLAITENGSIKILVRDILLIFLVTILIALPLIADDSILKTNDLSGNLANLIYIKKTLQEEGVFPQWNSLLNYGIPIVADPLNTFYNPIILTTFLTLPLSTFIKLIYIITIFLSGLFFYFLLGYLKIKKPLNLLISFTFMSSGFLVARIYAGHLEKILSYPLAPLFLLSILTLSAKERVKSSGLVAIILTLFIFSGAIYELLYAFIILVSVGLYQILIFLKGRRRESLEKFFLLIPVVLLFCLFSAIKLLPLIEISPYLSHARNPLEGSQNLVSTIYSLFFPFTKVYEQVGLENYLQFPYFWWERLAFIGLLPLLCLFLVPVLIKKQALKELWLFIFLFLAVLVFSMLNSPLNPFFWLFTHISFLQQFRIPSRIFIFLVPIVLVLSAFVLDYFYKTKNKLVKIILTVLLIVNFLNVLGVFHDKINKNTFIYSPPISDLHELLDYLKEKDNGYFFISQSPLFDKQLPVSPLIYNEQKIEYNYGFILKKDWSSRLANYSEIYPKYFIYPKGLKPPEIFKYKEVYTGSEGSKIYQNTTYTPYADIYQGEAKKLRNSAQVNADIKTVLIEPDKIEITANSDNEGSTLLVLESYGPGWKASMDNRRIELLENDFLNVRLELGEHKYTFTYRSQSFNLGFFISIFSFTSWIFYVFKFKNR